MVLTMVSGSSLFVNVQPTYAQFGIPQTSFTLGDIPRTIWQIVSSAWEKFGSRAFHQAVRSVSYRLAQESAVWVASGGKGQKPLLFQDPSKALRDAGDEVAGKFIVNLSQGWPIDLCSPTSIQSKLAITVGIGGLLRNPLDRFDYEASQDLGQRGCKLSQITDNFEVAVKKENFLIEVGDSFEVGGSELSSIAKLYDSTQQKFKDELTAEAQRRLAASEEKPVTDPITKDPKTTKQQIKDTTGAIASKAFDFINTDNIFVDTAFVFANTLSQTYLSKLQRGYYPFRKTASPDSELSITGSAASRKALLAEFDAFSPSRVLNVNTPGEIDLFSSMATCLTDRPEFQTTYHCLLNDGLQRAIQQKYTVKQAIGLDLIDPDTEFPQKHVAGEANLSLENLRKLRFLRVIPLGWEIAAERLQGQPPTTFGHIVECFKDTTSPDCSEFYGLIDPSWVLSLPQQYCRAQGWTSIPVHESSPARQQSCVDLQSCVKEDANGTCQVYGYCTREKSVWELQGVQCKPQFASCKTFTKPGGGSISLLGSDVNGVGCDAANAGCTWYSTASYKQYDYDGNGAVEFADFIAFAAQGGTQEEFNSFSVEFGTDADDWRSDSRIYLSGRAQSCSPNDANAREVVLLGPGINLVKNGDFKELQLALGASAGDGAWQLAESDYASVYFNGGLASSNATQQIDIKRNTYYTLSFDVSSVSGGPTEGTAAVSTTGDSAGELIRNVSFAQTIAPTTSGYTVGQEAQTLGLIVSDVPEDRSIRYAATFFSGRSVGTIELALAGGVVFDNVQLEEINLNDGAFAEDLVLVRSNEGIGLNIVRASTQNQASPSTTARPYDENPRFVFAQAESCSADEAMSRRYRALHNGDVRVAQLLPEGLCSQQCNGLDTYLSMPTQIDRIDTINTNDSAHRVAFIPSSTDSCSAQNVGCEEFTNLSNAGVESREYFNTIQSCVLPENGNVQTFYTWEGTDTSGFQLKSWQLLADAAGGPCTNLAQGRATAFNPGTVSCSGSVDCDPAVDRSCRIFLDEAGTEYFRNQNSIVTASTQCTAFRRTKDQTEWYFIPNEASQCAPQANGCREYKGVRANLSPVIVSEDFENGVGGWVSGQLSAASDVAGGSSYKILAGQGIALLQPPLVRPVGKSYMLEFRARSEGATGGIDLVRFRLEPSGQPQKNRIFLDATNTATGDDTLVVTDNWQTYKVGPVDYTSLGGDYDTLIPSLNIRSIAGSSIFIDNVKLIEVRDIFYALEQSTRARSAGGTQPDACYSASSGFSAPVYSSCRAYQDDSQNTYYVSRFNRLFAEESLSCRPVIDTANSDSPYGQTYTQGSGYTFEAPADQLTYMRIKRTNARGPQVAGCTALGIPDDPSTPTNWTVDYKKVDPDSAQSTFCTDAALGCQTFRSGTSEFYFRDPGPLTCEWSDTQNRFIKQDGSGCTDSDRAGEYVALCPADQNSCTAYLPTDQEFAGVPLYYKKDTVAPASDCTEGDISLGCVEFNEHYTGGGVRPDLLERMGSRLLKVTPERQCAEWLAPTTVSQSSDQRSQSARVVSHDLGRCLEVGTDGNCSRWADLSSASYNIYSSGGSIGRLDTNRYAERVSSGDTIFNGAWDYSGYSIPDQYPVELLDETVVNGVARLAYANASIAGDDPTDFRLLCRSYAEENAPFPRIIKERGDVTDTNDYRGSDGLSSLNLFEDKDVADMCAYRKVSSASANSTTGEVYYGVNSVKPIPADARSIEVRRGWHGYCVEYDESVVDPVGEKACLAWLPIDVVANGVNVFDNHPEAGFSNSAPVYQCVNAASNLLRYNDYRNGSGTGVATGLIFNEAVENTYVISVGEGTRSQRESQYQLHFLPPVISADSDSGGWDWDGGDDIGTVQTMPFSNAQWDQHDGFLTASGDLHFGVRPESPLSKLHEYDIESIKLITVAQEHHSWPANNEEFVLGRNGYAKASIGINPDTEDRWTALWCGGSDDASCDFGGSYSWNKFKPFFLDRANCGAGSSSDGGTELSGRKNTNLFAIRALFANSDGSVDIDMNADGINDVAPGGLDPYQFYGFEGGVCDNTGSTGWVEFAVAFQIREWCTDVAQVATIEENKGWSGRLNNVSQLPSGICDGGERSGKHCYAYPGDQNRDCSAGGGVCSLVFNVADSAGKKTGYFENFFTNDGADPSQRFTFSQDKAPYGLIVPPTETLFDPSNWDSRKDTEIVEKIVGSQTVEEDRDLEPGKQPIYVEKDRGQVRAGTPLGCNRGEECMLPPTEDGRSVPDGAHEGVSGGIELLRSVFAKIYGFWRWNFDSSSYEYKTSAQLAAESPNQQTFGWEFTGGGDAGQCPIIQSVEQNGGQFGPAGGVLFNPLTSSEYYNQSIWFTENPALNLHNGATTGLTCPTPTTGNASGVFQNDALRAGRYSIDGEAVPNTNGTVSGGWPKQVQIGEEVSLQFYAFNYNGEQLPIKEIYIDWNGDTWRNADGSGRSGPIQANTKDDTIVRGNFKNHRPDCDQTAANFGQTDQACDNNPFQFKHIYQTEENFSPVVRVTDNWDKFTFAYYNGEVLSVGDAPSPPAARPVGFTITGPAQISVDYNNSFSRTLSANLPGVAYAIANVVGPTVPNWFSITGSTITGTHNNPSYAGSYSVIVAGTHTATGQTDTVTVPIEAHAAPFVPGWDVTYYRTSGTYLSSLSDFRSLSSPYTTRIENQPIHFPDYNAFRSHLPSGLSNGTFAAMSFKGRLNISSPGEYSFRTRSDDGSLLLIDGSVVVNNGGDHGAQNADASIILSAGTHDIEVIAWNNGGPAELSVYWSPLGSGFVIMPVSAIFH